MGAKAWNLDQLHDAEGRHKYSAALESDIEYLLRHEVAGLLKSGSALVAKDPSHVENPSLRCLETLVELGEANAKDPRARALQVAWSTRLAASDPAALSRERAVLILGELGARLEVGRPAALPAGAVVASVDDVTTRATALVRAVRALVDPASLKGESAPSIDEACNALESLQYDIDGARRVIEAVSQLGGLRGLDRPARERLERTALDLERRAVRQGLALSFKDRDPLVRAAAVEAAVSCAGIEVLDSMLQQLDREPSPIVVVRVLEMLHQRGLPPPPKELGASQAPAWREGQLGAIYQLLLVRPQSDIHVAAMQVLSKFAGAGFESLREEDWQAWWTRRRAPLVPAPSDESGGEPPARSSS